MNNTAWWIIIFILILLILAAGEIYRETHTFRVRKYKVKTKKNIGIQNCVKVIFLSDLHNCVYGNKNDKLYKAIAGYDFNRRGYAGRKRRQFRTGSS